MALIYSEIKCEIREISLKDKPAHMLKMSPKGTVPVILLPDGKVIEESLEVMEWAIEQNDPENIRIDGKKKQQQASQLISRNDHEFAAANYRYKYSSRFPDEPMEENRAIAGTFVMDMDKLLQKNKFFISDKITIADFAIFPFIRQFSMVDEEWFREQPYPKLHKWLDSIKSSDIYEATMKKYDIWKEGDNVAYFPADSISMAS
jgi:glutathione S-transferase